MAHRGRRIALLFGLLVAIAALLVDRAWRLVLSPYPGSPHEATVVIPHGTSARRVGEMLAERGVIRHRLIIPLLMRLHGGTIRAGEYKFRGPLSPDEVLGILARGVARPFKRITVPEGLRIDQIADVVKWYELGSCEELLRLASDPAPIRDLDPIAWNLEGYLFPDTYHLDPDAGVADLVKAMLHRFREVMRDETAATPLRMSVREWVTLASLVEEETAIRSERPIVASVYLNRLEHGMLLQCDPTIIYAFVASGLGAREPQIQDLTFDHAYNTYLYTGLPPGPISSPGAASLHAVIHPEPTGYLYFVARGDGGHEFSCTLQEHNRAVGAYRRFEAQQRRSVQGRSRG